MKNKPKTTTNTNINTTISNQLLEELKTLTIKKKFNSLYEISEYLKEKKENTIIFDYIGILSYTEDILAYKEFKKLLIPKFGQEMNKITEEILTFFISCVKDKKYTENNYVSSGILQIISDKTSINSIIRKYFDMVEPLIKDKKNEEKAKIKLLILNPLNFERLYKEISANYFSFPSSIKDFYSYANLETNTSDIKNFVEKKKEKDNNNNEMNTMLNDLKNEVKTIKQVLNVTLDENKDIKIRLGKVENQLIEKENDIQNLKKDLYKINLRDSIKDFIDDLLWSFDIYISNANIQTKINEIKKKINKMIVDLQDEEKKYAFHLINFLDYLYEKLQEGNDISHYFNNIGFNKENLPDQIKQKFLEYSNGDKKYNYASLVMASYDSDKIEEKEKKILNLVIKTIIGIDKKNGQQRMKDIVNCFKLYSEY